MTLAQHLITSFYGRYNTSTILLTVCHGTVEIFCNGEK